MALRVNYALTGAELQARRVGANLTQGELAEALGVSKRTLQNWEASLSFPRAKHRRALDLFFAEKVAA